MRVCIHPWNHRDPFGLFSVWLLSFHVTAGGPWTLGWHGPTKTHPSCRENVPAWCTWAHYKTQLVATFLPCLLSRASASADVSGPPSTCSIPIRRSVSSSLGHFSV